MYVLYVHVEREIRMSHVLGLVNGAIIEPIYICHNHELVDLENVNSHLLLPFESRNPSFSVPLNPNGPNP